MSQSEEEAKLQAMLEAAGYGADGQNVAPAPQLSVASEQPVEKQRLRNMASGLLFGTSDEIEAGVRSLFSDDTYRQIRDKIRSDVNDYNKAYLVESIGYELLGAALPALIPVAGEANALRVLGRGALEGITYGLGTSESNDLVGQGKDALTGGVAGMGGSAVGQSVFAVVKGVGNGLINFARRTIGGRGSSMVENELQRLVAESGKSIDEVVTDIANGKLLSEIQGMRSFSAGYVAKGGEAENIIRAGQAPRMKETSAEALTALKNAGGAGDEAVSEVVSRRSSAEANQKAVNKLYEPFKTQMAPQEIVDALKIAMRRGGKGLEELDIISIGETGGQTFYKILDDGDVIFTRSPTMKEAEDVGKAIRNKAQVFFKEGKPDAGQIYKQIDLELKSVMDEVSPDLKKTRAVAKQYINERNAYEAGEKSMGGDVNKVLADFHNMSNKVNSGETVAAFRAGLMTQIENKATTARSAMLSNMADETHKFGMLIREVFPENQVDTILLKIDNFQGAKISKQTVTGGSPTSSRTEQIKRQGKSISAIDAVGAIAKNPASIAKVAFGVVRGIFGKGVSDRDSSRIAKLLVEHNPDLVKRALVDESGMQALTDKVNYFATNLQKAGRGVSTISAADFATYLTNEGQEK